MATRTMSNLKQPAAVAPRTTTTSNLKRPPKPHHRATTAPGVVDPSAASKLHQRATAASVVVAPAPAAAPRTTTSNLPQRRRAPAAAAASVVEPPPPPAAAAPNKTSSRRVAERDTATHDFTVVGYSKLKKALGVGQYVSSDAFRAGGHEWEIRFYPKLLGGAIAEYRPPFFPGGASLHLRDPAEGTELTVRFTLGVLQRDGRSAPSPMATRTATEVFGLPPRRQQRHGFHRLVEGGMLRAWQRQRCVRRSDDAITIRCALTVVRATDPVPAPELVAHLGRLLAAGMGADVEFRVDGRAFPSHRALLAARSPVFCAELFGGMAESTDAACVEVVGVRPEIFELLLQFVYTDALPGDGDGCDAATVQHLLVAADRYGLDRLKHICEWKLHASVDAETVASMLALAEHHNCPRLRDVCVACMSSSSSSSGP